MTLIVNTFWGGRVSQVVDRQITGLNPSDPAHPKIIDTASNKICIVLASNALVSIAYTGIAEAHRSWLDCVMADVLAYRHLGDAIIQPGIRRLARPIHRVVDDFRINMNGRINSDKKVRGAASQTRISIVGWHFRPTLKPLAWELRRQPALNGGHSYFELHREKVGRHLQLYPRSFCYDTLGNDGGSVEDNMLQISRSVGLDHDGVERLVRDAVVERSKETRTVSASCMAVQIDPFEKWQVQVTYYPGPEEKGGVPLVTPWVMTPRLVCAPTLATSEFSQTSDCGRYALGGFTDGNTKLHVRSRIPLENKAVHVGEAVRIFGAPLPRPLR